MTNHLPNIFDGIIGGVLIILATLVITKARKWFRARVERSERETEALLSKYRDEWNAQKGIQAKRDYRHNLSEHLNSQRFLCTSFDFLNLSFIGFVCFNLIMANILITLYLHFQAVKETSGFLHLVSITLDGVFLLLAVCLYMTNSIFNFSRRMRSVIFKLQKQLTICTEDISESH